MHYRSVYENRNQDFICYTFTLPLKTFPLAISPSGLTHWNKTKDKEQRVFPKGYSAGRLQRGYQPWKQGAQESFA